MSCTIKNIDNFCTNVLSLQISGGAFNNTTVNIEILSDSYGTSSGIRGLIDYFDIGDVMPVQSGEDFIIQERKTKLSSSGVTTSIQYIDKYSYDADSYIIGLTGRSFGDAHVGKEYFMAKGLNHRDGIDGYQDLLFERGDARIAYNRLATPGTFLKASGEIGCLPVGHKNWDNPPNMEDPDVGFGDIFYTWADLMRTMMPFLGHGLKFMSDSGALTNGHNRTFSEFEGLYNYDGTIRDVLGNIARQHGYVYSPNALIGGHVIIDVSSDFGKMDVLENAGIGPPPNATESSKSTSWADGYSTGCFLRSYYEGHKQKAEDIVLPRRVVVDPMPKECKPGWWRKGIAGGQKDSFWTRWDDSAYWGKAGDEPRNPEDAKRIDLTEAFKYQEMPNFDEGLGGTSIGDIATGIAAEMAARTQLAKDVDAFYRMKDSGKKASSEEAIINTFTGQEGHPFLKGGKLVDGWEMFEGVNDQLQEIENYNPFDTSNKFWENCGTGGKRYSPELQDIWMENQGNVFIISQWHGDNISQHGDQVRTWDDTTYGYMNFGDKGIQLGEKIHYSMHGEPNFELYQTDLNSSVLGFLSGVPSYAGKNFGEALATVDNLDGFAMSVDVSEDAGEDEADQYICRGAISIDLGGSGMDRTSLMSGLEQYADSVTGDVYLIAEDAHGMPNDKSLAGKAIMQTSGKDSPVERWNKFKEGVQKAIEAKMKNQKWDIEVWWDGIIGSEEYSGNWTNTKETQGDMTRGSAAKNQAGKNGPQGAARKEYGAYAARNRFHPRSETFETKKGCPMPNRSITTGELHYSYDDGSASGVAGYGPLYLDSEGQTRQARHKAFEPVCVPYLSKISFTLINELYDFGKNPEHIKYLENMNVTVAAGKLTATYTFSQKVQIPDLASLYTATARAQQVR